MKNKYNMTKEDNIFYAKRKLIDNIYKSANLEGIAVTFADTVSFLIILIQVTFLLTICLN